MTMWSISGTDAVPVPTTASSLCRDLPGPCGHSGLCGACGRRKIRRRDPPDPEGQPVPDDLRLLSASIRVRQDAAGTWWTMRSTSEASSGLRQTMLALWIRRNAPVNGEKKVAVLGGGPGGLSAAYYLQLMGHQTTVYEMLPKLGGMLRYGIPNYRLPKDRLDDDINAILKTGAWK